ncbi:hypothetical protein [Candidimonas nitroreducens]|uniref:hypothetical protein n=1 Tax=Candidimonas nitroreducens TaxID=683354 RepID=UPI0013036B0E|nr:hypothetical protein [Candidimonas nitroreducens]
MRLYTRTLGSRVRYSNKDCPIPLPRIAVRHDNDMHVTFPVDIFGLCALAIAALYCQR